MIPACRHADYRRAHVPGGTYFFTVNTDYIHWNPVKQTWHR